MRYSFLIWWVPFILIIGDYKKKFEDLHIQEPLKQWLKDKHFKEMTAIQEEMIPLIIQGKEMIGLSETGSGKTHAFLVPIFEKIDVNGSNTHPLYVYLKQQKTEDQGDTKFKDLLIKLASLGEERGEHDLKWNFTKFLINRDGVVVARYAPSTTPLELEDEIKALLA